jgi:uncharacterized cupin superfamily protein
MSKETRQPFTSTGEYHTRRGFRFSGRNYAPNVDFPWRQLCVSPRKLRQLYEGRFIEPGPVVKEAEAPPVEVPEVPVTEDEVTTEETEEKIEEEPAVDPGESEEKKEETEEEPEKEPEKELEKEPEKFTFNPKRHKVQSAGSGKWKVTTKSGKFRLSVTREEAQRLKKVKKPTEVRPEEIVE